MPRPHRVATLGMIFLAGLGLTVALQWAAGSYGAELGGENSDEAPHYINGLLVARYLQSGFALPPMRFAALFYQHYPKVSIGHWPPLFYVVEAAWMLASASRASVMLLSATITAALATLLAGVALPRYGRWAAGGVALAFLLLPLVREMTAALLVDIAVALLDLVAALAFIAYLRQPGWQPALGFGLAASAAILTKGNGLALVLLPPVMILLTRHFSVLRRGTLWLSAAIVAGLCGPWTIATYALAHDGFFYDPGLAYSRLSLVANAGFLASAAGLPCLALALVGVVNGFRRHDAEALHRRGLAALCLAVFAFQVAVPVDLQSRYMIPLFGPAILLAAAGIADLARQRWPIALGLVVVSVTALPGLLQVKAKPHIGMIAAAQTVAEAKDSPNSAILVAAGASGEGAFVVEMALRNITPPYDIARGTKFLASADFNGGHYISRFANPADLAAAVAAAGFGVVVLDTSADSLGYPHNRLVQQAAALAHWPVASRQRQTGASGETIVYRLDGHARPSAMCAWRPRIAEATLDLQLRKLDIACPE